MRDFSLLGLAAAILASSSMAPAHAQQIVKIGELRCEVSGGLGLVITSSKEIGCRFIPPHGRTETYFGKIQKFGLDIGVTNRGVLIWDVLAPTTGIRHHALQGEYVGVGASATVGVGVGANALVGGSERSFTLQPLSVQGQTGLALAAGVEALTLRAGH